MAWFTPILLFMLVLMVSASKVSIHMTDLPCHQDPRSCIHHEVIHESNLMNDENKSVTNESTSLTDKENVTVAVTSDGLSTVSYKTFGEEPTSNSSFVNKSVSVDLTNVELTTEINSRESEMENLTAPLHQGNLESHLLVDSENYLNITHAESTETDESQNELHQGQNELQQKTAKSIESNISNVNNFKNHTSNTGVFQNGTDSTETENDQRTIPLDYDSGKNGSFVLQAESHISSKDDSHKQENTASAAKDSQDYDFYQDATPVRKCCEADQYFSLVSNKCEYTEYDSGFREVVRDLLIDTSSGDIEYITGTLTSCPKTGSTPNILQVMFDVHAILAFGHFKDLFSGIVYDHEHYCLELAAQSQEDLLNAILVGASCNPVPLKVSTRKCCELDHYWNYQTTQCHEKTANTSNYEVLVHEFLKGNHNVNSISITTGRLKCRRGVPKLIISDDAYLDNLDQLCERQSGKCYPMSIYCIEHMWAEGDTAVTPVAAVCPLDVFHKCCPRNQILSETGCILAPDHSLSARMMQLLEMLEPQIGFPAEGGQTCEQRVLGSDELHIQWWISNSGYLKVNAPVKNVDTMRYCVDDHLDPTNETHAVAVMCYNELDNVIPVDLTADISEVDLVGKCCHHGEYMTMEDHKCVTDDLGLDLLQDPQLHRANVTQVVFTDVPICQHGQGYHYYSLEPDPSDYGVLEAGGKTMQIVGLDHGCVMSQEGFSREEYCVEYAVNQKRRVQPIVIVCSQREWSPLNAHSEKFSLTAVLLGTSCTALIATAISLISMRVRRGLVTVKKVNTLAGRILLSYVLSYLVGFLVLAIGMKATVDQESIACQALAGILMFFLLAAFHWNTSICLESLLLTLRVSTSEGWRYLCHSLWAWGVPGIITTIALTLDAHRANLSCSVITPRIGVYRCFFSDNNAQLVYLYVPMFITLLANMGLLAAARQTRTAKLRKLEHGPRGRTKQTATVTSHSGSDGERGAGHENGSKGSDNTSRESQSTVNNTQHSGLRTHQTRNLWTESLKLVIWSGATWLLEVIGFIVARYLVTPSGYWYDYLWYLPASINSLRGVGIFIILVLTPENRLKLLKAFGNLGSVPGSSSIARHSRSADAHSSSGNHQSSGGGAGGSHEARPPGRRNMSIVTTLTQLSSFRSRRSSDSHQDSINSGKSVRTTTHPRIAHSVSQMDSRRGSASSECSDYEGLEMDAEIGGGGGRRKSSLANFGLVSLPSVDEEDVFEDSSVEQTTLEDTTRSVSNV